MKNIITLLCCFGLGAAAAYAQNTKQLDPELIKAIKDKPHGEVMYQRVKQEVDGQMKEQWKRQTLEEEYYRIAATRAKSSVVALMEKERLSSSLSTEDKAFFKGLFMYDKHIKKGKLSNMDRAIKRGLSRLKSHLDENKSEDEVSRDIREIYTLLRLNQDVHPYLNMDDRMAREIPVYLLIWTGISSRPQPEQDELKQAFKEIFTRE